MDFQFHLSQGFLTFSGFAIIAAFLGTGFTRLLICAFSSNSPDDRMGSAFGGIALLVLGVIAFVVAFIMAFVCQYAAYALLVAVFCFAAGIAGIKQSSARR